jgi:hypothetical protein
VVFEFAMFCEMADTLLDCAAIPETLAFNAPYKLMFDSPHSIDPE